MDYSRFAPCLYAPPLTPARREANRRHFQKSSGPRTARGKAQSRMNSQRGHGYSPAYQNLLIALLNAPRWTVEVATRAILTPEEAAHSAFREAVEIARQAEIEVVLD